MMPRCVLGMAAASMLLGCAGGAQRTVATTSPTATDATSCASFPDDVEIAVSESNGRQFMLHCNERGAMLSMWSNADPRQDEAPDEVFAVSLAGAEVASLWRSTERIAAACHPTATAGIEGTRIVLRRGAEEHSWTCTATPNVQALASVLTHVAQPPPARAIEATDETPRTAQR